MLGDYLHRSHDYGKFPEWALPFWRPDLCEIYPMDVRKREDQDSQESLEALPTGEDPKGVGDLPSHEKTKGK
jgi:hypothetical protein